MKLKNDFETYFKDADKVLRGLNALGAALGLTRCTKAIYEPLLNDAKAKAAAFDQARAGKAAGYGGLRQLRPGAKGFLRDVRNHLSGPLGDKFSAVWVPLGFAHSLELPRTDAGRGQMLEKLKKYFTDNPQRENAADHYTAARADELCGPLTAACVNVDNCKADARVKRDARQSALKALDKKLGDLRRELESVLDAKDPRWLKFYDRIPGDPRPPEKVVAVTATAQPGGVIVVDWPDTPRAARYKVLKQVVGTDADFVVAETVEESDAQLRNVPSGATVKLKIVPVNGVGPGTPSDVIELQAA